MSTAHNDELDIAIFPDGATDYDDDDWEDDQMVKQRTLKEVEDMMQDNARIMKLMTAKRSDETTNVGLSSHQLRRFSGDNPLEQVADKSGMTRVLKQVTRHKCFDAITVASIIIASIVAGVESCVYGKEVYPYDQNIFFVAFDVSLTVWWGLEWLLRLLSEGWSFFDSFMQQSFTVVVWLPLLGIPFPKVYFMMRNLRIITRWLHIGTLIERSRNVHYLRTSWLLVKGMYGSPGVLIGALLLVAMVNMMYAVIACNSIGQDREMAMLSDVQIKFRSVAASMQTMMRFMTSDNAQDIMEEVAMVKGWWFSALFFFSFMALSQYVLMNLVTAVIVDKSRVLCEADEATKLKEKEEETRREVDELGKLFHKLDADDSGEVSIEEFCGAYGIKEMRNKLIVLGIEATELKTLFKVLDTNDGAGSISLDEFVENLPKLYGQANAYDMLVALKKVEKSEKLMRKIEHVAHRQEAKARFEEEKRLKQRLLTGGHDKDDDQLAPIDPQIEADLMELEVSMEDKFHTLEGKLEKCMQSCTRLAAALNM